MRNWPKRYTLHIPMMMLRFQRKRFESLWICKLATLSSFAEDTQRRTNILFLFMDWLVCPVRSVRTEETSMNGGSNMLPSFNHWKLSFRKRL